VSDGRPTGRRPALPARKDHAMADLGLLVLTIALFGLLALVLRGVERL
jgi:hypothetical protein